MTCLASPVIEADKIQPIVAAMSETLPEIEK